MSNIKLFESKKVRTHWDEEKELWYFSIIDVIGILTGSNNPRRYWSDLKRKLEQEDFSQLYDIIVQLKLESRLKAEGVILGRPKGYKIRFLKVYR